MVQALSRSDIDRVKMAEENGNIDCPNTQIHDHSLSWLSVCTSIKHGKLIVNRNTGDSLLKHVFVQLCK